MRSLPVVFGAGILACSGLVHGILDQRGVSSVETVAAVSRMANIPMSVGDWTGQSLKLNENQVRLGQIAGYSHRRYENQRTGDAVSVLVVCGRPGPISVHTPEACYGGIGYVPVAPRVHHAMLVPQPAEFWKLDLRKPSAVPAGHLRILYGWNVAGSWQAPAGDPRLIYSHAPFLYKLYILREMRDVDEPLEGDPSLELASQLIPEIDRALFPDALTSERTAHRQGIWARPMPPKR